MVVDRSIVQPTYRLINQVQVYRKIKKRQRDRVAEADLEANGELEEVRARKRAEERMSLRHKVLYF